MQKTATASANSTKTVNAKQPAGKATNASVNAISSSKTQTNSKQPTQAPAKVETKKPAPKNQINSKTQQLWATIDRRLAKTSTTSTPDPKAKTSEAFQSQLLPLFTKTIVQLLEQLHEVFPECDSTAQLLKTLSDPSTDSVDFQRTLVGEWHDTMSDYYMEILQQEYDRVFEEKGSCPIFMFLSLKDKFYDEDFSESRETLMEYINHLNAFSCFYSSIPGSLLKTFETIGTEISGNISNDLGDDEDVTLDDVKEKSKLAILSKLPEIMKTIEDCLESSDPSEIENFKQSVPMILEFMRKCPSLKNVLKSHGLMNALDVA